MSSRRQAAHAYLAGARANVISLEVTPGSIHQHQLRHALRVGVRHLPGDLPAQRVAGQHKALHAELVHCRLKTLGTAKCL